MNPEELLSRAKRQADQAEVFSSSGQQTEVAFEANRLKRLQTSYFSSTVLRVIKDGKIGIAAVEGQGNDPVQKALEATRFGMEARFHFPHRYEPTPVDVLAPETGETIPESLVALGEELISRIRKHTPELLCELSIVKGRTEVCLLNSNGGEVKYSRSYFVVDLEGTLIRGTDMLFVGDVYFGCRPPEEIETMAAEVIWQLEQAQRQARIAPGTFPVILTPRGLKATIFTPLSMAFNGRLVFQKASPLTDKLGKNVFSPALNIFDDGTVDGIPSSRPWDDEGIPSQRVPLVREGVVSSFLYDLQTAGLCGTSSTGSAHRGPGGIVSPGITALVIEEGSIPLEDMVKGIREGLIVDMVIGAEMGNVLGGDISGNVLLGFKIENGEIVGRVKDTMISGNIYKVLQQVEGVGDRGRWVGNFFSPPLCLHLAVSAKR